MIKGASEQFIQLKELIDTNLSILSGLYKQSESLSSLITQIQEPENDSVKQKLTEVRKEIDSHIGSLLNKTSELFEIYKTLVEKLFD